MSTIEDLNLSSITDLSAEEGIELLRQMRLSRRQPVKKVSKATKQKKAQTKSIGKISKSQAEELLKLLET